VDDLSELLLGVVRNADSGHLSVGVVLDPLVRLGVLADYLSGGVPAKSCLRERRDLNIMLTLYNKVISREMLSVQSNT
jgi:hypothetical protein